MQIVIDISELDYEDILNGEVKASSLNYNIFHVIRNGTPLPKGHGRLIDVDALEIVELHTEGSYNWEIGENTSEDIEVVTLECIRYAPTIIEADYKVESGGEI